MLNRNMKKILSFFLTILFLWGCKTERKQNLAELSDLNLIIETSRDIDSVWVSDIGQRESYFLPFNDTVKVRLKGKLNDLYNIYFHTKEGPIKNQLWLNGENVIIKGKIGKELKIDTVLSSDLYYTSISFLSELRTLMKSKADSMAIDHFLLEGIKQNVDNPFSYVLAGIFIQRDQNNKRRIHELYDLLKSQDDTRKSHFLSTHSQIENILKVDIIEIAKFKFFDIDQEVTSINLDPGKAYLLDFWFVNCAPCVKDHKVMARKLDLLKDHNIELFSISIDKKQTDWQEYLVKNNYNWKNYREIDSLETISSEMAIGSFPTYLLINSQGKIDARFNSYKEVEKHLMK